MMPTLAPHWNARALERNSERIGLLYHDDSSCWDALEQIREDVCNSGGQFISLDFAGQTTESLPEMLLAALKNARWDQSLQFSLPTILQHNPRATSPFISRAILWQRLCDLLIADDDPYRETVLLLENVDQASPGIQHEIVRLIHFHEEHSIHRTFIFSLNHPSNGQIISNLRVILDEK